MRNVSLAFTLLGVMAAAGCGGAENTTANNSANPVAVNSANPTNMQPVSNSNSPIEMANSGRGVANGANPTEGENVKPMAQPAPENSEFTMVLTDVGTETRTFKGHPQIDKVVRIVKPGSSSIKVYLKNGKVVDLPGDKIRVLKTVSSGEILAAAGVTPPPPPPPEPQSDSDVPTKQP